MMKAKIISPADWWHRQEDNWHAMTEGLKTAIIVCFLELALLGALALYFGGGIS